MIADGFCPFCMAAEIERLQAALRRIDSINDNPAIYNREIDLVIEGVLGETPTD